MMESCYCYGGLTKTNKYIVDFKVELGEALWNEVYEDYSNCSDGSSSIYASRKK